VSEGIYRKRPESRTKVENSQPSSKGFLPNRNYVENITKSIQIGLELKCLIISGTQQQT
jgi:hypothetical protein